MASLLIFQQSSVDVIVTRNFSTLDIKALYQISVDGKHYAIKIRTLLIVWKKRDSAQEPKTETDINTESWTDKLICVPSFGHTRLATFDCNKRCCLPHGTAQEIIKGLPKHLKIVDLSAAALPQGIILIALGKNKYQCQC
ncbi:N-acetyl-gamma-glutamyl-phosphate reductase [Trifolium repens]|nr:N-acetyl-gamma-glutamyl-phosphate reductase [Trifolium repens]